MRHGMLQEMGKTGIMPAGGGLGDRYYFEDINYRSTSYGTKQRYSREKGLCQLVVNRSNGTLAPGVGVKWEVSGEEGPGLAIGSVCGAGEQPDGIVDGAIPGTVADNETFMLILAGPTWLSAAGDGRAIAIGDKVSGGLASGRFAKDVTDGGSGLVYASPSLSTAYASSDAKTIFDRSHTIPKNTLRVGDRIIVEATIAAIGVTSTPTLTLETQIGTVVMRTTGAVTVAANDVGRFRVFGTITAIGASGAIYCNGESVLGVPGTKVPSSFHTASQTLDTTGDLIVGVYGTWSANSASNTARLTDISVSIIPSAAVGGGEGNIVIAKSLATVASGHTAGDLFRARVCCEQFSAAG